MPPAKPGLLGRAVERCSGKRADTLSFQGESAPPVTQLFLAIETSCDETAAAVFSDEPRVLSNIVASQIALHARFGGVVPEVAARAHLERMIPVIEEALEKAGVTLQDLSAIAVHNMPGLIGSLLIGVSACKQF